MLIIPDDNKKNFISSVENLPLLPLIMTEVTWWSSNEKEISLLSQKLNGYTYIIYLQ
jgi:hypothetical protein